jgi:hypothetical protein
MTLSAQIQYCISSAVDVRPSFDTGVTDGSAELLQAFTLVLAICLSIGSPKPSAVFSVGPSVVLPSWN